MTASQSPPMGTDEGEMRTAFAAALVEAMRSAGIAAPAVAARVNLTPDAVRKWTSAKSEPSPRTVFVVEALLGTPPGDLSRHLGFIPVEVVSVTAAIDSDPVLTDLAKGILRDAYRAARR